MDDEAQAETEAETDTEAPSDGCRRHRIIRSRAGSQQQQLTPAERKAKQKADRAERNAKSNAKRNLNVARDEKKADDKARFKGQLDAGALRFGTDFWNGSVQFSRCTCAGRVARLPSRARASTSTVGPSLASRATAALRVRLSSQAVRGDAAARALAGTRKAAVQMCHWCQRRGPPPRCHGKSRRRLPKGELAAHSGKRMRRRRMAMPTIRTRGPRMLRLIESLAQVQALLEDEAIALGCSRGLVQARGFC